LKKKNVVTAVLQILSQLFAHVKKNVEQNSGTDGIHSKVID